MNRALRMTIASLLLLMIIVFVVTAWPWLSTPELRKSSVREVQEAPFAVVFGAGYYKDGTTERLYQVTAHRVEAAVKLYEAGKVKKILVSGDNSVSQYNEPLAMIRHALNLGVSPSDICADYGGRSTYDTCYRAHHIFGIENGVMVTQAYHLPRAVYLCRGMGMDAQGLKADASLGFDGEYINSERYRLREMLATWKALWEVHWVEREAEIMGPRERNCSVDPGVFPPPGK